MSRVLRVSSTKHTSKRSSPLSSTSTPSPEQKRKLVTSFENLSASNVFARAGLGDALLEEQTLSQVLTKTKPKPQTPCSPVNPHVVAVLRDAILQTFVVHQEASSPRKKRKSPANTLTKSSM
jgi:hypothetical protein